MSAGATTTTTEPAEGRGVVPALLWACFLGCSWTWVIGMVFPVLLLRDYGPWGWVVFAVPNVLGAAAMGLVLARPAWSARLAEKHRDMCLRFSEVTIAYHAFVVGWLVLGLWGWWAVLGVAVGVAIVWSRIGADRSAGWIAVILAAASLVWLGYGVGVAPEDAWVGVFRDKDAFTPRLGTLDLILFAPAAVMGFVACPYLDLTFHRARRATAPVTGIAAFAIGFGVVFLAMIVGSLAYAGLLVNGLGLNFDRSTDWLPPTWATVLVVHLTIQIAFTAAAHGHEVTRRVRSAVAPRLALIVLASALVGYSATRWGFGDPAEPRDMSVGETVYRLFLLAYGLVFPAYVWLCVIPTIRPTNPHTRKAIFVVGAVITFPMGWLFFVAGRSPWIIAILATLLALRIIVETTPRYVEAPLQSPPSDAS